jgi:hypothetical protein
MTTAKWTINTRESSRIYTIVMEDLMKRGCLPAWGEDALTYNLYIRPRVLRQFISFGTEINTFRMKGAFHMDPKALQFYQMPWKRPKALQGFFSLCV